MGILVGKSREGVMGNLYSQILSLEKDLGNDKVALSWFNFSMPAFGLPSTPRPEFQMTPSAIPNFIKDKFQGK